MMDKREVGFSGKMMGKWMTGPLFCFFRPNWQLPPPCLSSSVGVFSFLFVYSECGSVTLSVGGRQEVGQTTKRSV